MRFFVLGQASLCWISIFSSLNLCFGLTDVVFLNLSILLLEKPTASKSFFFFKMSHLFLNLWGKNCEQRFQEDTGRDDRTRIASVLLLTSSVSSETLNLVHVFPRRCTESLLWNRPARLLESVWTLPPLQRHSLFVCLTQRRYDETCVVRDSFLKDKSILIMHFPWDVVVLKATLLPRKIWEIP